MQSDTLVLQTVQRAIAAVGLDAIIPATSRPHFTARP